MISMVICRSVTATVSKLVFIRIVIWILISIPISGPIATGLRFSSDFVLGSLLQIDFS